MLLAVDTTDRGGSVALARGKKLLELNFEESFRNHSARLMPLIDEILAKHQVEYRELNCLGVATGPGSFTGIRLGVTTAKTLALACEARVVPVTNLRLQVEYARGRTGPVESIIDARRGELYRQRFYVGPREVEALTEPQLIAPAGLKEELKGGKNVLMVYRDRSWEPERATWPDNVNFYCPLLVRPLAGALASIGAEKLDKNETVAPGRVKPLYVRPSDARRAGEK